MAYAAYSDELGYTWAGVDTIAFDTGYGVTTVKDVRRALIAAGWMASKRRFGTSSIVRLNLDRMTVEQVDRGESRMIHPELEFEPETPRSRPVSRHTADRISAGRAQLAATRLTVGREQPPRGCLDSRVAAVYSAATRPVSVSESSDDPSVDAPASTAGESRVDSPARNTAGSGRHRRDGTREGVAPPEMREESVAPTLLALTLVAALEFGPHRRPNRAQARVLACRVDAALQGGLTLAEVRRHAQATVNAANPPSAKGNAVRYLINGLAPDRLPVPQLSGERRAAHRVPEQLPAGADSEGRRVAMAAVRALPAASSVARRAVRATERPRPAGGRARTQATDASGVARERAAGAGDG
jgi:hypothetical protein